MVFIALLLPPLRRPVQLRLLRHLTLDDDQSEHSATGVIGYGTAEPVQTRLIETDPRFAAGADRQNDRVPLRRVRQVRRVIRMRILIVEVELELAPAFHHRYGRVPDVL